MKGDAVLAITAIFSEPNKAFYVALCDSQQGFGVLRPE
jgi:hypothetical protein